MVGRRPYKGFPAGEYGACGYQYSVDAIANLIIPVGAMIYASNDAFVCNSSDSRKMRATEAKVHSVVTRRSKKQEQLAHSMFDSDFKYVPGQIVKPSKRFSKCEDRCDSGIHFFVNLHDALTWG
jgi:hypothetical protein